MFKKIVSSLYFFCVFCVSFTTFTVSAVNEKECSIWLCLPSGFPNGCSDAYSAFKDRIKKGKSPLPDFGSCLVADGQTSKNTISAYQGPEIQIIPHTECVKWGYRTKSKDREERYCLQYKDIPAEFIRTSRCPLPRTPEDYSQYCVKRNIVEVYDDGKLIGDKFYY